MKDFVGFRKLEPSHYYFTRSLKSLESMKNVPLDFYIMVDFGGLRMLLSRKCLGKLSLHKRGTLIYMDMYQNHTTQ